MSTLSEVKEQLMNLIATYYSIDKSIPDLAAKAQMFIEQDVRRRELGDQIADLEESIDPIAAELASLKDPFIDALYDENVQEQTRIRKEKKRLEAAIVGVQEEVEKLQKQLDDDPVDVPALVSLTATLEAFDVPNASFALQDLTQPLRAVESGLASRVGDVRRSLIGVHVDEDQLEAYRLEHDPKHRARKESERIQELKYAAQAEKRGQRYRAVLASNSRENEIAGGVVGDDRITEATVSDSRLADEN